MSPGWNATTVTRSPMRYRRCEPLATTTPDVIQELAHGRSRRLDRSEAVRVARDFSSLLGPLLTVDDSMLALGLRIFEETPGLGSFDAVLCAAAIGSSAEALVSADRAFGVVSSIRHLDPAAPGFLAWLEDRPSP